MAPKRGRSALGNGEENLPKEHWKRCRQDLFMSSHLFNWKLPLTYTSQLEWLTSIPWPKSSSASFSPPSSIIRDKIKKRQIEYLAVVREKELSVDMGSSIRILARIKVPWRWHFPHKDKAMFWSESLITVYNIMHPDSRVSSDLKGVYTACVFVGIAPQSSSRSLVLTRYILNVRSQGLRS